MFTLVGLCGWRGDVQPVVWAQLRVWDEGSDGSYELFATPVDAAQLSISAALPSTTTIEPHWPTV